MAKKKRHLFLICESVFSRLSSSASRFSLSDLHIFSLLIRGTIFYQRKSMEIRDDYRSASVGSRLICCIFWMWIINYVFIHCTLDWMSTSHFCLEHLIWMDSVSSDELCMWTVDFPFMISFIALLRSIQRCGYNSLAIDLNMAFIWAFAIPQVVVFKWSYKFYEKFHW